MKTKVLCAALCLGISSTPLPAMCYLCDRSDWNSSNQLTKTGFVMGAIAQLTVNFVGQEAVNAYNNDLVACVVDLDLNAKDLVDIVDQKYLDLEQWEHPPHIAFSQGLREVCLAHMNRARAERGAELLSP